MTSPHDELLQAAVAAQQRYETLVAQAKAERREAFHHALRGPVKAREIAEAVGLSESMIGKIARGER